jgi:hypothetical protein
VIRRRSSLKWKEPRWNLLAQKSQKDKNSRGESNGKVRGAGIDVAESRGGSTASESKGYCKRVRRCNEDEAGGVSNNDAKALEVGSRGSGLLALRVVTAVVFAAGPGQIHRIFLYRAFAGENSMLCSEEIAKLKLRVDLAESGA